MMSACGVLCSVCPAHQGQSKGITHQGRTKEAWFKIYGLNEKVEDISCCGCIGPDEEVFYTSRKCRARICCRSKGFSSCAECTNVSCMDLERAQSVWDDVPKLINKLSAEDFEAYAKPYCDHRERLASVRISFNNPKSLLR